MPSDSHLAQETERREIAIKELTMATKTIINTKIYEGMPLSASPKGDYGFNIRILDAIRDLMDSALARHPNWLFMLFTFSYPSNGHKNQKDNIVLPGARIPDDNSVFVYFLNQYIRALNNSGCDTGYLWVREQTAENTRCHYHLAILFNRDVIQYFRSMRQIDGYWSQALAKFGIVAHGANTAGLIDRGRYEQDGETQLYGMSLHRGNRDEYMAVFQRASYLAKDYSKDAPRPINTRTWGRSER